MTTLDDITLEALLRAVHRCIMEIGRKRRLVDFENCVRAAREALEEEIRQGLHW